MTVGLRYVLIPWDNQALVIRPDRSRHQRAVLESSPAAGKVHSM